MGRESNAASVEKMTRAIHLINDLAGDAAEQESQPAVTLTQFALLLGLSKSEALRVIDKINLGCGDALPEVFIDYDEETGTIEPCFIGTAFERTLRLSPAEARGLVAAVESCGIDGGEPLARKIKGLFPPVQPGYFSTFFSAAKTSEIGPTLQAILKSINEKRALKILYHGLGQTVAAERLVEPRDVSYDAHEGAWYMRAFCRTAGDWRTFKIDRIAEAEATRTPFSHSFVEEAGTEPTENVVGEPGTGAVTGAGTGAGTNPLSEVDSAPTAFLAVHRPAPGAEVDKWRGLSKVRNPTIADAGHLSGEELARGAYIARIPWAPGSTWLPAAIAQTFGDVEAIRPPELREAVVAEAERMRRALDSAFALTADSTGVPTPGSADTAGRVG